MKHIKKLITISSAAAVLIIGSSFSSMAAQSGWVQNGDTWNYLDSSGNRETDTWKKSGNSWFYLDSNGDMATDQWVEETYYVNAQGTRLANQWVYADAGTDGAPNSEGGWFYFDNSGKVVTDGWKTLGGNKKYHFASDGTMDYGWFTDNDSTYYLGDSDQGWAQTGWLCLDYDTENPPSDGDVANVSSSASDSSKWFYFQSNGKAVKASTDIYISKTINGKKYYFDGNGVMLTGWVSMATSSDAAAKDPTGISSFKYFGDDDDGQMSKGWRYLTDFPEDSDDSANIKTATSSNADADTGDGSWYYFDNNGVPKYLDATADCMSRATSRINGQSYFFDSYGRMQYGLISVDFADGTTQTAYFGNSDADGKMKTDKTSNVEEDNGDRSTFYFETAGNNKGAGYTGDKKNYLYYNGKLVKADKGSTTQVFEVNDKFYLVNESGQIQKSNKCYKSDGDYRYEISGGTIYNIDADKQREGEVTSGESLPEISCRASYSL